MLFIYEKWAFTASSLSTHTSRISVRDASLTIDCAFGIQCTVPDRDGDEDAEQQHRRRDDGLDVELLLRAERRLCRGAWERVTINPFRHLALQTL